MERAWSISILDRFDLDESDMLVKWIIPISIIHTAILIPSLPAQSRNLPGTARFADTVSVPAPRTEDSSTDHLLNRRDLLSTEIYNISRRGCIGQSSVDYCRLRFEC
jgi:hypothetical protein